MIKKVDCRGLNCPQPVIHTKKALEEMTQGSIVTIVDNEVAKENVKKFAQKMNAKVEIEEKEGIFYLTITKENGKTSQSSIIFPEKSEHGEFIILIGNDKIGEGSEELGSILMKSYLYTLTEVEPRPDKIIFMNSGVKLTCSSSSLENIKKLEELGVEILSCGTCLDYYGLKQELQVGKISNMYTIVEALNEARKSIVL
ncbi:sulfurtransferase-like selenium metabolism protein YedF [Garciella nitratireducens]|uniref:Selenium metabolism protein YedF n=1 Tax=Garciella nitratireducens DSM 15102 TaxID=1121911 RepID=A0A1T4PE70_9FIRM|nr:sulfurtransferase-like selenium metabolism protein YedF [Garciella nitratireducens]SJZ89844.1 selenium metabolism protein YedF [Garciella nitratireducens DSM 15102]